MKSKQAGFTLIELVVVIVIIGILMATAMPRLTNIENDAKKAVVQGTLASVNAASQMMYAHWRNYSTLANILSSVTVSDPLVSIRTIVCAPAGTGSSLVSAFYTDTTNLGIITSTIDSVRIDAVLCSG